MKEAERFPVNHPKKKRIGLLAALVLASALFSGCFENVTPTEGVGDPTEIESEDPTIPQTDAEPSRDGGRYAYFHAEKADGPEDAKIDVSALSDGYVAVSSTSEERLKFQVRFGDLTYNYDLSSDGTPSVFPLQCGNGTYLFRIMENVSKSSYAEKYSVSADVVLTDEFAPFLINSDYVDYTADSYAAKTAYELTLGTKTDVEAIKRIYDYVCLNIRYDYEKAKTVTAGYMPVPDETLRSRKGICFDYAALTAAMLRSLGVPTKMVFGYVAPKGLYHAWNMFYTEETGWVTVSFEVKGGDWCRIDLTFSANGADPSFIGDGTNYTDVYYY